jgi:hypothetical protein
LLAPHGALRVLSEVSTKSLDELGGMAHPKKNHLNTDSYMCQALLRMLVTRA